MDVSMEKSIARTNELPFLDMIANLDCRSARSAKMLAHRDDYLIRYCWGFYGFIFCIDFAIVRMNPTSFKGFQHQKSPH